MAILLTKTKPVSFLLPTMSGVFEKIFFVFVPLAAALRKKMFHKGKKCLCQSGHNVISDVPTCLTHVIMMFPTCVCVRMYKKTSGGVDE